MVQRDAKKSRRTAGGASSGRTKAEKRDGAGAGGLEERCKSLEAERDRLRAELETAKAEIVRLDGVRRHVANRIDWVIDSLHNIIEGER